VLLKVEEFDCVGLGWTGPSFWRRVARERSGSEASRFIPIENIISFFPFPYLLDLRVAL